MPDEKALIPVFVPPLANVLAAAELKKGSPLTAREMELLRDRSACIMMHFADTEKMAQSRGFVDVNPQNCWADWHRLRVQMIGRGYLPKIVLCIPGNDELRSRCEPLLKAENIEHEFRPRDQNLLRAFKAASMCWPEFTPDEFAQIEKHRTVLYALSENFTAGAAPEVAVRFLNLGQRILEAGGFAIKCESSGIAHPPARWARLVANTRKDDFLRWSALFRAYVIFPIGSATDYYTCGMHLLGAPDIVVSKAGFQGTNNKSSVSAAAELLKVFATYLLTECPVGKFASGHTFSIDRNAPRYVVQWEPCTRYDEDEFFFNPFGQWRLNPLARHFPG